MRKHWFRLLLALAVCVFAFIPCALANGWGLRGELLGLVSGQSRWNDYTTACEQVDDVAVMRAGSHHVLMTMEEESLCAYTPAVYQRGESVHEPELEPAERGFILRYGTDEWYRFARCGMEDISGEYWFEEAQVGAFHVTKQELTLPLRYFSIQLFPRSQEELSHLNLMRAALNAGRDCLGVWHSGQVGLGYLSGVGKNTAPVYTSPYGESAYRAGNGKAAVGLQGEIHLLEVAAARDGVFDEAFPYACVRYDVNNRRQRIGYVDRRLIGGEAVLADREPLRMEVCARCDTWLTDDPDVSQARVVAVPEGAWFTCMGIYNDTFAYVSAEVDSKDCFTDGGAILWGFVPLRDVALPDAEPVPDVAERLTGAWTTDQTGEEAGERLALNEDGGYLRYDASKPNAPTDSGRWQVSRSNPFWNLFATDVPYLLTLQSDSGRAEVYGLAVDGMDGFRLVVDEMCEYEYRRTTEQRARRGWNWFR